jgi:hypothetical protein
MAKRALIVDWGDRDVSPTILQACALGELDNYLYKPWSPAEVHLYPLIGEFLSEWTQIYRPGMGVDPHYRRRAVHSIKRNPRTAQSQRHTPRISSVRVHPGKSAQPRARRHADSLADRTAGPAPTTATVA